MTVLFAIVLILAVAAFVISPLLARDGEMVAEAPGRRGELWAREKAVAVLAITEADFDRATGKLSDDDYRVLRTDYEGRALHAMDQMDQMDKADPGPAEGTVRFCAGCGSPFCDSDSFCGSCGRRRFAA